MHVSKMDTYLRWGWLLCCGHKVNYYFWWFYFLFTFLWSLIFFFKKGIWKRIVLWGVSALDIDFSFLQPPQMWHDQHPDPKQPGACSLCPWGLVVSDIGLHTRSAILKPYLPLKQNALRILAGNSGRIQVQRDKRISSKRLDRPGKY